MLNLVFPLLVCQGSTELSRFVFEFLQVLGSLLVAQFDGFKNLTNLAGILGVVRVVRASAYGTRRALLQIATHRFDTLAAVEGVVLLRRLKCLRGQVDFLIQSHKVFGVLVNGNSGSVNLDLGSLSFVKGFYEARPQILG